MALILSTTNGEGAMDYVREGPNYGGFGLGTLDEKLFSPRFFLTKEGDIFVDSPQNKANLQTLKENLEKYPRHGAVFHKPKPITTVPQKPAEKAIPAMQMHEQQIAALKQENEMHRKKIAELKAKSKAQKTRITALETNVRQSGGSIAQEKLVLQQKEEQIRELSQNLAQVTAARKRLQENWQASSNWRVLNKFTVRRSHPLLWLM